MIENRSDTIVEEVIRRINVLSLLSLIIIILGRSPWCRPGIYFPAPASHWRTSPSEHAHHPSFPTIYSAELRALLLALELIEGSTKKHFIIFSDSLSAMQALKNPHPDHPLVGEILSWHTNITSPGT